MKPKMIWFLAALRLVLLSWVLCPASCQSFRSCCQYNISCQMKMFIPDVGYQKSFLVHYNPDTETEENVIRCEWSNEGNNYTCNCNHGYSCEILENKSILINIGTDLQPGNFSFWIPKKGSYCNCSWNPKESCRNISSPETSSTGSSTAPTVGTPQLTASSDKPNNVAVTNGSVHNPPSAEVGTPQLTASSDKPNNVAVTNGSVHNPPSAEESSLTVLGYSLIVGFVGGVVLLIGIVGIIIYCCKKQGVPWHKKPNNPDSSKDYTEQPLNTERDESEGENNSPSMLSVQLISETSKNSPESSEDCTEQPLSIELHEREGENNSPNNRSTGDSSSYHPRNSEVLHSRGLYIEDISFPSQTNIPGRGRARIYRTKMPGAVSCMEPDSTEKQDVMKQMSE